MFGVGNRGMETGMSCEENSKRENLSNSGKVDKGKLYTNINLNSIYFNSTLVRLSSAYNIDEFTVSLQTKSSHFAFEKSDEAYEFAN